MARRWLEAIAVQALVILLLAALVAWKVDGALYATVHHPLFGIRPWLGQHLHPAVALFPFTTLVVTAFLLLLMLAALFWALEKVGVYHPGAAGQPAPDAEGDQP